MVGSRLEAHCVRKAYETFKILPNSLMFFLKKNVGFFAFYEVDRGVRQESVLTYRGSDMWHRYGVY